MKYAFKQYSKIRDVQPLCATLFANEEFRTWWSDKGQYLTEDHQINELLGWAAKGLGAGLGALGNMAWHGPGLRHAWDGAKAGWKKGGEWDRSAGNWMTRQLGRGASAIGNRMATAGSSMQQAGHQAQGSAEPTTTAAAAQEPTTAVPVSKLEFDNLTTTIDRMTEPQKNILLRILSNMINQAAATPPAAPAPAPATPTQQTLPGMLGTS